MQMKEVQLTMRKKIYFLISELIFFFQNLTFPAPTGPITANSFPGLTLTDMSLKVGCSDS